ncbi:hypothetical protein [Sinorhizobium medicae]|uniref:hypothetical protein n=1 Tax=Sinorhizobium medicae TaxID=110321 RepID=UPI0018658E38|nr:hypothetical protein [Sinorhizobium medicae]
MISDNLRSQADHFIFLITLRSELDRHSTEHMPRTAAPLSDKAEVNAGVQAPEA